MQNIKFENSFLFDISINSISGNIECAANGFHLGVVRLDKPVNIDMDETKTLPLLTTLTEDEFDHFQRLMHTKQC
jgi:hypothetical protein